MNRNWHYAMGQAQRNSYLPPRRERYGVVGYRMGREWVYYAASVYSLTWRNRHVARRMDWR